MDSPKKNVRVVVSFRLKEKHLKEHLAYLKKFILLTENSPGCLSHEFLTDNDDPTQFLFLELWKDEEHFKQHTSSDYFKDFAPFFVLNFDELKVSVMDQVSSQI